MKRLFSVLCFFFFSIALFSQQIPDPDYHPQILQPEYAKGEGPIVFIDEGHHNFHTKEGRYKSFSNLLERDGYVVKPFQGAFTNKKLKEGRILVISNALNEKNERNWYKPVLSAFLEKEIKAVTEWVKNGGSLFLIADHMPFGGAAKDLAAQFGFEFTDGFAMDTTNRGPAIFSIGQKTLMENSITKGRNSAETVEEVVSFTGQGFKIPDDAFPILVFDQKYVNLLPDTAWVFTQETEIYNIEDWSQGAFKQFGKGRVVTFGEAAMFSAQLAGPEKVKMGMNNPIAANNYKLLLNVIHWLDGKIE